MISVLTPTIRIEGLKLVDKALSQQSHRDFEWIIASPTEPNGLKTPFRFIHDLPAIEPNVWTLNSCYNRMIEQSKGDLLVTWQDYTYAKPDTLERFWFHFLQEPKTLITAVGNKYESDDWSVQNWKDPRERDDLGAFYQCYWTDIEWNLASIPKSAVVDIGGFDEVMDQSFGLDGYSVNERVDAFGGYDFKIDQTIKSYSLGHGRVPDWDKLNAMNGFYENRKKELKALGTWPVLSYLKTNTVNK